MPAMANLASNLTFPKGLQTTTQRSQEIMAKDQRAVMPVGEERTEGAVVTKREYGFYHETLGLSHFISHCLAFSATTIIVEGIVDQTFALAKHHS